MPEYGGFADEKPLSKGALQLFQTLKEIQTGTVEDLVKETQLSDRSIRNYLAELKQKTLIKELPNIGRTKKYAVIDYVPQYNPHKPLAQRFEVFSQANNSRFSVGELATYYGNYVPTASVLAAELLFKAPALLVYYAQENEMTDEEIQAQLDNLRKLLEDGAEQLQSAISIFKQLTTDERYWRTDLLMMFKVSPDYVLNSELPKIIDRLRGENEESNSNSE